MLLNTKSQMTDLNNHESSITIARRKKVCSGFVTARTSNSKCMSRLSCILLCLCLMLALGNCLPSSYNMASDVNVLNLANNADNMKYSMHRPRVTQMDDVFSVGSTNHAEDGNIIGSIRRSPNDYHTSSNILNLNIDNDNNANSVRSSNIRNLSTGSSEAALNNAAAALNTAAAAAVAAVAALDESNVNGGEVLASKTFPISPQEPSCEELRAMWIFSRRQSRAAEMTNEIPTYRDPFTYNVWEPFYPTPRSIGWSRVTPRYGERTHTSVFGRVTSREPLKVQRTIFGNQRQRFSDVGMGGSHIRKYGSDGKSNSAGSNPNYDQQQRQRSLLQYRLLGSNGQISGSNNPNSMAASVQGSFQKLKQLIWTERAKELSQQRWAEETATRAAVLKEIANGQNIQSSTHKHHLKQNFLLMDENRTPEHSFNDNYEYPLSDEVSKTYNSNKHNNNSNNSKQTSDNASYLSTRSSGSKPSNVYLRHLMPKVNNYYEHMTHERDHLDGVPAKTGLPKSHPIRPSHFRERNHFIFKQNAPMDYFQRHVRTPNSLNYKHAKAINLITDRVLSMLESFKRNPTEYMINKLLRRHPSNWIRFSPISDIPITNIPTRKKNRSNSNSNISYNMIKSQTQQKQINEHPYIYTAFYNDSALDGETPLYDYGIDLSNINNNFTDDILGEIISSKTDKLPRTSIYKMNNYIPIDFEY